MKSVLISIQPKWCELIASGKKILEVRKTRPNIKTPFKCYIYCTLSGSNEFFKEDCKGDIAEWNRSKMALKKGKVIGEFVCKSTLPISVTYSDPNNKIALREFPYTCLSDKEIMDYLGNGKQGWGWHISNFVIYDKPKELSEFVVEGDCSCNDCNECKWFDKGNGYNVEDDCRLPYEYDFKSVKYYKLSQASGLPTRAERMQVSGFSKVLTHTELWSLQIKGIISSNGIQVSSVAHHVYDQVKLRKLLPFMTKENMEKTLTNPLKIGKIKLDDKGRKSQQFIGDVITLAVNPDTGVITTIWKTSSKKVAKLKKGTP